MDYAIIELGGKQYRVEKGDSVVVDRVDAKEGAKLTPRAIFFSGGGEALIDGPELDKVKVEAVVAEHLKGEKIRVFKYRPKKRTRRRAGHRALLTRVEIGDIKHSGRKAAAAKKETGDSTRTKRSAPAKGAKEKPKAKKEES